MKREGNFKYLCDSLAQSIKFNLHQPSTKHSVKTFFNDENSDEVDVGKEGVY